MKTVLIDIEGVVLSGADEDDLFPDIFCDLEIERLVEERVPLYAVTTIDRSVYRKLRRKFPALKNFQKVLHVPKIFNLSDFGHRFSAFLSENNLRAEDCVYAFGDRKLERHMKNSFFLLLTQSLGVDAIPGYWTEQLRTRFIVSGVYWPDARSSSHAITVAERELVAELLRIISMLMCKKYEQLQFGDDDRCDPSLQYAAKKGALITHMHTSAYERTVHCLEMWGIVRKVDDITFKLLEDAQQLSKKVRARSDINREMFAWALEAFFDLDAQAGWAGSSIEISSHLIVLFKSANLLMTRGNKLCWTDRMEPYFHCCIGRMMDSESAHDFFAKVVTDKRVSHTLQ